MQDYSNTPMISNYPALDAWLQKVNGRCLFQEESSPDRRVEGWSINGALVVIILYAQKRGFHVLTEPNTISIEATFADAERRIATPAAQPAPFSSGFTTAERQIAILHILAARVRALGAYDTTADRDALASLSNERLLEMWRNEVEGH